MNRYWSKSSGPDCIAVVVLKNCEPEYSYILADLFNKCLKESCFLRTFHVMVLVFKNVGERSATKNYCHVALLSVVSKVFEKLVNNKIVDRNMAFILTSSVVLRLFNQLQIFLLIYLTELLELLTGLELLELWHLIYPRFLAGFGMLVFFTNLSLMGFQVKYLALFFFSQL